MVIEIIFQPVKQWISTYILEVQNNTNILKSI